MQDLLKEAKVSEAELYSEDTDVKKKVQAALEKVKKDTLLDFISDGNVLADAVAQKATVKQLAKLALRALLEEKKAAGDEAEDDE